MSSPASAEHDASEAGVRRRRRADSRAVPVVDLDTLIDAVIQHAGPDVLLRSTVTSLGPLGLAGGALIVLDRDGKPTTMSTVGVSADIEQRLGTTVVDGRFPVMAALTSARPLWLRSYDAVAQRFPTFAAIPSTWQAYAAVPLRVEGELVGSMALPFDAPQVFGSTTRINVLSAAALVARGVHHHIHKGQSRTSPHSTVFDRMHDGVVVVDRSSNHVVQVNSAALDIFGLQRADLIGHSVDDVVALLGLHLIDTPRSLDDGCTMAPLAITRPDGVSRVIESYYALEESPSLTTVVVRSVAREESHTARSLLHTQEALYTERSRVARDLHDGVVQSVFAVSLSLASLALRSPEPARSQIEESIDGLDAIVRQVRSTVFDLRRRQADIASVRIAHEVTAVEQALGFMPTVHIDPQVDDLLTDADVPCDVIEHLLLALREAISNVARHARATAARVEVQRCADVVRFTVTDNGIGIAPSASLGDGLTNLRQRAASLGGDCSINCGPQGGTSVIWWVPVGNRVDHTRDVAC